MIRKGFLGAIFALGVTVPAFAVDAGKAVGTVTIDGTTMPLALAVQTRKDNLFDDKKKDLVVVVTDKALGSTKPDDEIELSMKARRGELIVLAMRIDGSTLVNVTLSYKGLSGLVILPGSWFQYTSPRTAEGTLKLASREFDRHRYAVDVEFAAGRSVVPRQTTAPPAPAAAPVAKTPPVVPPAAAPATTSNLDRKQATALLIQALMQRDEHRALEIIKLGVDPNGRDQSGIPVLNWAVMMCPPAAVKALVDGRADLKYERAPGMTILMEAGACPEAARVLRAAGAR